MENLNEKTENKISENQKTQKPEAQPTQKLLYEPPKATFVPLKLEERLLACYGWSGSSVCTPVIYAS